MSAERASNHAAIDIGTNSIHMLVAAVGEDTSFEVLTTEKETVRLGEGPGEIRELSPEAMDRGVATLRRFRAIADSFDANIDAVATSAVREAENGPAFVRRCIDEAGISVDVISGVEEARLIHLGVLQALPVFEQQVLIADIGGGSTEMLIGRAGRVLAARSLKLGHLRLTNRFFPKGVISGDAVQQCRDFVRSYLTPTINTLRPLGFQTVIGSSGTVTAIGDLIRLRNQGDIGGAGLDTVIDHDSLIKLVDELTAVADPADRAAGVDGLESKRADVIVAGALLLEELFRGFGIDRMLTSPYALREGVLLDRTHGIEGGAQRLADLRRESLLAMADAFDEDQSHVQHATDLALKLFDGLVEIHGLAAHDREFLEAAGLLHNVGLFVSHSAHHQHSYYIIRNSDRLTGYTERETEIIAQVARYHRRSAPKPSHAAFTQLDKSDRDRIRWLAGMLRIAIALDRTRSGLVADMLVSADESKIRISALVAEGVDASVEVFMANSRSALLADTSGRIVEIV